MEFLCYTCRHGGLSVGDKILAVNDRVSPTFSTFSSGLFEFLRSTKENAFIVLSHSRILERSSTRIPQGRNYSGKMT